MSKAEERALEKYPAYKSVFDKYEKQRYAYICGYIQAEKDNELTWKDINTIIGLYNDLDDKILCNPERACKDILKRLKERKHGGKG